MSGGQIQRHLPSNTQRYSETTQTAQVHVVISVYRLGGRAVVAEDFDYEVFVLFFRILVQICKTQAFQKLNPAQFDLHDEVTDAMQVSHHTWEIIAILMFSTSYNCKYSSHYFYIRKVQRTGS